MLQIKGAIILLKVKFLVSIIT